MKQFISKNKKAVAGITLCLAIGGSTMSFQDMPYGSKFFNEQLVTDTVPTARIKNSMTMKEFDALMNKVDQDILKVAGEIKKIEWDNMQRQTELALTSIDIDKIMKEVEVSMKQVDVEKILSDVTNSLEQVEVDKSSAEVKKALSEAKNELENARMEIKNIDQQKIKKDVENARIELEKSKGEFSKLDMNKIMNEAKTGIDQAKNELRDLKDMFLAMEQGGLIKKKEGFKIRYKNDQLFINGEKQPQQVTGKYKKYFKEDDFEIEIEKE